MVRNAMAEPAVTRIATQGQSARFLRAKASGNKPSSDNCDNVRATPVSGASVP